MHKQPKERPVLTFASFERGFVAHMVGCHPVDQTVYGNRVKDYAVGVAKAYRIASKEDGRSTKQCVQDDIEFWPTDHGMDAT